MFPRVSGLCFPDGPLLKSIRGQEAGILAAAPVWPQLNLPDVSAQQIESFRSRDADDNQQAADKAERLQGNGKETENAKPPATESDLGEVEAFLHILRRNCATRRLHFKLTVPSGFELASEPQI